MKLNTDSQTLAENKALILYVMNKVSKPMNNEALFKLVISVEDINYFYFQQFLLDLIDNKYITTYEQNNDTIYELTLEGKKTLELTADLIPGITKFKVDNNFKENLSKIENEMAITTDFIPHNENEYSVNCKITENNQTLFEVQTYAGTHEQAKKIADNWSQNANEIYPEILKILQGK